MKFLSIGMSLIIHSDLSPTEPHNARPSPLGIYLVEEPKDPYEMNRIRD